MKKLLIALIAIVVVVGAVGYFTTKTFRVEITIAAPPEAVWKVLADTKSYPDWNPVFAEVVGKYEEGAKVLNKVRFPDGKLVEMNAHVTAFKPGSELRQSGGVPLVLTFDHRWTLEAVEGGTKVVQHELDRGFYLHFWDSGWIEPAYRKVSEALKARVESGK